MAKNENERICIYCGAKSNRYQNICGKCYKKLPAVKELVAICQSIKSQVANKESGT
jgi:predicted amidophosphoribosyltransferase